jgi:hypothetical protein
VVKFKFLLPQVNGHTWGTLRSTHSFDGWCRGTPMCLKRRFSNGWRNWQMCDQNRKGEHKGSLLVAKVVACVPYVVSFRFSFRKVFFIL